MEFAKAKNSEPVCAIAINYEEIEGEPSTYEETTPEKQGQPEDTAVEAFFKVEKEDHS